MTSRDSKPAGSAARAATAGPVYEQPLNERMRTFLRLDFLYQQTLYHEEREDPWSTRAAVELAAGNSCNHCARRHPQRGAQGARAPDERDAATIRRGQASTPGALRAVLSNLARLRTELNSAGALFMQRLRDSEFLNSIKHRSTIPGGTCEFDLPDYRHWLDQPFAVRAADFGDWMTTIRPLCDAVTELLWLTREAGAAAAGDRRRRRHSRSRSSATIPASCCASTLPAGTDLFPGDQRQPPSLQHPLPALDRSERAPAQSDRGREVPS